MFTCGRQNRKLCTCERGRLQRDEMARSLSYLPHVLLHPIGPRKTNMASVICVRLRYCALIGWHSPMHVVHAPSRVGLRASPPMEPILAPNGHVCATCITFSGSPNVKPKLRGSCLNIWLAWALPAGGPLSWLANHPKVQERESSLFEDRHRTVCSARGRHSTGN